MLSKTQRNIFKVKAPKWFGLEQEQVFPEDIKRRSASLHVFRFHAGVRPLCVRAASSAGWMMLPSHRAPPEAASSRIIPPASTPPPPHLRGGVPRLTRGPLALRRADGVGDPAVILSWRLLALRVRPPRRVAFLYGAGLLETPAAQQISHLKDTHRPRLLNVVVLERRATSFPHRCGAFKRHKGGISTSAAMMRLRYEG